MAGLRDFLYRFRPAGTPGAPTPGAVPGDRAAEHESELEPLLTSLADVEAEAERIRADGAALASSIRQRGEHEAAAIVENAQRRAGAVRAAAAAKARADGVARSAAVVTAAGTEAARLREQSAGPVAARAARVVAEVADGLRGGS